MNKALPKERLAIRPQLRLELALYDRRVLTIGRGVAISKPSPARPEDERGNQTDYTNDYEDDACHLDIDA